MSASRFSTQNRIVAQEHPPALGVQRRPPWRVALPPVRRKPTSGPAPPPASSEKDRQQGAPTSSDAKSPDWPVPGPPWATPGPPAASPAPKAESPKPPTHGPAPPPPPPAELPESLPPLAQSMPPPQLPPAASFHGDGPGCEASPQRKRAQATRANARSGRPALRWPPPIPDGHHGCPQGHRPRRKEMPLGTVNTLEHR